MATWSEVERAARELAAFVRPRFALDELWLGMMPDSHKALDLRRDPRFAIHAATIDRAVTEGDAKLSGRAIEVEDEPTIERFRTAFAAESGYPPPAHPFHLF